MSTALRVQRHPLREADAKLLAAFFAGVSDLSQKCADQSDDLSDQLRNLLAEKDLAEACARVINSSPVQLA